MSTVTRHGSREAHQFLVCSSDFFVCSVNSETEHIVVIWVADDCGHCRIVMRVYSQGSRVVLGGKYDEFQKLGIVLASLIYISTREKDCQIQIRGALQKIVSDSEAIIEPRLPARGRV